MPGSPNGPTASSTYIRTTAHNKQFLWILYPIGFDEHVFGSSVNPSVLGTPFQDCTTLYECPVVPSTSQGDNDDYELHLIYCIYLLVVLMKIIDGFGLFMMGGILHI